MSFENDFKRMWEPIESAFHGVLIEKLRKKNFVPFQDVIDAWENEKKNWLDPMRIQNSFLRTMEQRNPAYAKDFHDLIKSFSFQKDISRELPSFIPYAFGILIIATLGGIICYLLSETSFILDLFSNHDKTEDDVMFTETTLRNIITIMGGIVFAGWGKNIMQTAWKNKSAYVGNITVKFYLNQLKSLKKQLSEVCRNLDKNNFGNK